MIDKENMRQYLIDFYNQSERLHNVKVKSYKRIFVCGMGGSALPGILLKSYIGDKIPVEVVRDYNIPSYIKKGDLIFIVSYSGNTEETLSMLKKAHKTDGKIIVISSGGKLETIAKRKKLPYIKVPSGLPPRTAIGYMAFSMLYAIGMDNEIKDATMILKKPLDKEGLSLAKKLRGKVPVIYASERNFIIAYKWKIGINENAKTHAFYNLFSEMNHNEILGYEKGSKGFTAIMIRDDNDNARIRKRMDLTKRLINVPVIDIKLKGKTRLARLFYGMYYGDWVSYHLALLNKVDPSPVKTIDKLKKMLK